MSSEGIFLTREGFEKLRKELDVLKTSKRREIAGALKEARLFGDLSENAEYDSAKQALAINEKRISELEQKLARAKILGDLRDEDIPKDKAYVGARVRLSDLNSKEEIEYMLVTEDEADFAKGKISISSPVGKALLGKKKDDIVEIKVPAGRLKYKIMDISR